MLRTNLLMLSSFSSFSTNPSLIKDFIDEIFRDLTIAKSGILLIFLNSFIPRLSKTFARPLPLPYSQLNS